MPFQKGHKGFRKLYLPFSKETKEKMRQKAMGRIPWNKGLKGTQIAWNKGMKFPELSGKNSPVWKPKIKKICPQCNKEFEVHISAKRRVNCSKGCYWKTLKGKISWMKGKKHSQGTLDKISETLSKRGLIVWNKNKKFTQILGNKHWNWKGGTSPLYEAIRNTFESTEWRRQIFERDNWACQDCFKKGGDLEAHHLKSFTNILQEFLQQYNQFSSIDDKETLLRLSFTYEPFWDINNGKTLCEECHKKTDNYLVRRH